MCAVNGVNQEGDKKILVIAAGSIGNHSPNAPGNSESHARDRPAAWWTSLAPRHGAFLCGCGAFVPLPSYHCRGAHNRTIYFRMPDVVFICGAILMGLMCSLVTIGGFLYVGYCLVAPAFDKHKA